jgi:superfamily II DNA or RNA helicase
MGHLRDICLQVRYSASPQLLVEQFFAPASNAATSHKVRIATLGKDELFPIALALAQPPTHQQQFQILIVLELTSEPSSQDTTLATDARIREELLRKLPKPSISSANFKPRPLESVEIRVCAVNGQHEGIRRPANITGYFTDQTGATVSYSSYGSHQLNPGWKELEVTVAWSWGDPRFRVNTEIAAFEELWSGKNKEGRLFIADDELKHILLETLHHLNAAQRPNGITDQTIRLFPHQENAVQAWTTKAFRGVFKMCTGAGKTISALAGVKALSDKRTQDSCACPAVVITVPTRVLADQWIREIKRFGFRSVLPAYNAFEQWNQLLEPTLRDNNPEQPRFIVTTYRTFSDQRFLAKLERAGKSGIEALWIADEMHNLASPKLRDAMKICSRLFAFRLGLSATPEIEGDMTATEGLLNYFGNICASYELADGIKDGVLCKYAYYPVPAYLAPALGKRYLSLLAEIDDKSAGSTTLVNLYREARDLLRTSGVQIARFRDLLNDLVTNAPDLKHTLIYCPPGYGTYGGDTTDEIDQDEGERRLIEEVIEVLRSKHLTPASILGETTPDQRTQILERFSDGRVRTLCAIGCLDEGVDVPAIKRAVVLYSVDREKQFVQRRGRILRQPRGTVGKVAEIYDIVILPQGSDMPRAQAEALLNRELRRYREFARLAQNQQEAEKLISDALSVITSKSPPQ